MLKRLILLTAALFASLPTAQAAGIPDFQVFGRTASDFYLAAKAGKIEGAEFVDKFGSADAIPATGLTPITTSKTYFAPTTAVLLDIVSDDTQDSAAGTGLREVTIEGIGADWRMLTQTVVPDGLNRVALGLPMLRVFRVYGSLSGSYATTTSPSHNSTLTVRDAGGADVWAKIEPYAGVVGLGQSEIGIYTIPKGKIGFVYTRKILIESAKAADVLFFARENADDITAPYSGVLRVKQLSRSMDIGTEYSGVSPMGVFVGPTDLGFRARGASTTTAVSVNFEILLLDDPNDP